MRHFVLLMIIAATSCVGHQMSGCVDEPFQTYQWLDQYRNQLKSSAESSSITQYLYNGSCVYLIAPCENCTDAMSTVYNASGEELCRFGGIAGFNTCPDFSEKATDEKVIFMK